MSEPESAYDRLPDRKRLFVDYYLAANCCAAAAARRAGYSERTAASQGHRLRQDPDIQAAIRERLAELTMPEEEVLARLTEQGRNPQAAFLKTRPGTKQAYVDMEELLAAGLGHLVKKVSWDKAGNQTVEFYCAQTALTWMGKHHALFTEKFEGKVEVNEFDGWTDKELDEYSRTGQRPAPRTRTEGMGA